MSAGSKALDTQNDSVNIDLSEEKYLNDH